ncbi:MAG: zf-TFIIB domain-containing protein [Chloroflexota bacterium]
MYCPVCPSSPLIPKKLEENLSAQTCLNCQGDWIKAEDYWAWLEAHGNPSEQIASDAPLPIEAEANARLCPEDGRFLRRFQIFPNAPFYLERCSACLGVWFDANEWHALKQRELHDEVHLLFGKLWQEALLAHESRNRFEKMYLERYGAEDYGRVQEIRLWLDQHPKGTALLAYLTDRDPYRR